MENNQKPLLCRMGLHKQYHYLPRVGGDLGEICIACRRCGFGQSFRGWDITPQKVQKDIAQEAQIEYGRVLGIIPSALDPLEQMEMALRIIKDKFTVKELAPIEKNVAESRKLKDRISELKAQPAKKGD